MKLQISKVRQLIGSRVIVPVVVTALVGAVFSEAIAARRPPASKPPAQPTFVDPLDIFDTSRWSKADGWTNGSPFDNIWRAANVVHSGGVMSIVLNDKGGKGEPYASGEYRTNGFYGYGCYEARFKPVKQSGVVTSFFTFAGPYDNGGNRKHNEIDVEFVGKDTTAVQFNFWTNDDQYVTNNAVWVELGFDASLEAHDYGFKWTEAGITWYVDGMWAHEVSSKDKPTPKATESLQKIMMNAWPVDQTAAGWAGPFVYPGAPLHAEYEWVRYDSDPNCSV
jgi:beta-glucanase (GH16 family)